MNHWSMTAIFDEYRRFAGSKSRCVEYVCMYVCMLCVCVCMYYVCMYAYMYVCMLSWLSEGYEPLVDDCDI